VALRFGEGVTLGGVTLGLRASSFRAAGATGATAGGATEGPDKDFVTQISLRPGVSLRTFSACDRLTDGRWPFTCVVRLRHAGVGQKDTPLGQLPVTGRAASTLTATASPMCRCREVTLARLSARARSMVRGGRRQAVPGRPDADAVPGPAIPQREVYDCPHRNPMESHGTSATRRSAASTAPR
jgi:hypothetical protein